MQLAGKPFVLVDVRDPGAFAKAHIQGAAYTSVAAMGPSTWAGTATIVVYCGAASCPLSHQAAEKLLGLGYASVFVLEGGLASWKANGYPVQSVAPGDEPKYRAKRLSLRDARGRVRGKSVYVLDVRPAIEFSAGHVPGAHNVPLENLSAQLPNLPKSSGILVLDRRPSRARSAAETLVRSGFSAYRVPGDLAGWVHRGYEIDVR
jgi:rhodanese-related sulfurtransferase